MFDSATILDQKGKQTSYCYGASRTAVADVTNTLEILDKELSILNDVSMDEVISRGLSWLFHPFPVGASTTNLTCLFQGVRLASSDRISNCRLTQLGK